jgi:hypothetical protein
MSPKNRPLIQGSFDLHLRRARTHAEAESPFREWILLRLDRPQPLHELRRSAATRFDEVLVRESLRGNGVFHSAMMPLPPDESETKARTFQTAIPPRDPMHVIIVYASDVEVP